MEFVLSELVELVAAMKLGAAMKLVAAIELVAAMELVAASGFGAGRASAGSKKPATRATVVRDWSFMFAGWVKFESVGLN